MLLVAEITSDDVGLQFDTLQLGTLSNQARGKLEDWPELVVASMVTVVVVVVG